MSLQRINKICCYAKPCKSHFQLLSLKLKIQPTVPRSYNSEMLIQKNNLSVPKNGVHQNQTPYIESLCKSFDLSSATNFSPCSNLMKQKKEKQLPTSMPVKKKPCEKCAKIRRGVKKFFNSNFITKNADGTKTGLTERTEDIPMLIHKDEQDNITLIPVSNIKHSGISESHTIANNTVCFGCDQQPKREPSIRGPPIISPVCNVSASPLGEIYKNLPERIKKVIRIDRPRSLGTRKRMVDKDQTRETSVNETKRPHGR